MAIARMTEEIVAAVPARVGLLADVSEAVKAAGVNITAISAYERDGQGVFLLVTDDNAKASVALARLNADIRVKDVVIVELPDRPGALEDVAR